MMPLNEYEVAIPNRQFQMVAALFYCNDVIDIVTLQQPLPQAISNGCCSIYNNESSVTCSHVQWTRRIKV